METIEDSKLRRIQTKESLRQLKHTLKAREQLRVLLASGNEEFILKQIPETVTGHFRTERFIDMFDRRVLDLLSDCKKMGSLPFAENILRSHRRKVTIEQGRNDSG